MTEKLFTGTLNNNQTKLFETQEYDIHRNLKTSDPKNVFLTPYKYINIQKMHDNSMTNNIDTDHNAAGERDHCLSRFV